MEILKISSKSNPNSVAGAIAGLVIKVSFVKSLAYFCNIVKLLLLFG